MKNKGFVFIETIIMIVILSISLLVLYGSYSSTISDDKRRLTYDDVSYIYRNYYILDYLLNPYNTNIQINDFKSDINSNYILYIGYATPDLFSNYLKESEFESIMNLYHVNSMYLVSSKIVTDNVDYSSKYNGNITLQKYIESMDINGATASNIKYYLVVEYNEKYNNGITSCISKTAYCKSYYASIEIPIDKL